MNTFLNRREFQKWKRTSGRKKATYKGYRDWVTSQRASRANERSQELATGVLDSPLFAQTPFEDLYTRAQGFFPQDPSTSPMSMQAMARLISSYGGGFRPGKYQADPALAAFGPKQLRQQATGLVSSQVNPVIAEITKRINSQTAQGKAAIEGYTGQLVNRLGSLDDEVAGIYSDARSEQERINAALAGVVSGTGADQTAALQAAAAQGGAAPSGAERFAEAAAGATSASAAQGASTLGRLVAQGAAATDLAAAQPGLADRYGQTALSNFLAQQGGALEGAVGDITAQVPGLVANTYQSLLDRELQKSGQRFQREDAFAGRAFQGGQAAQDRRQQLLTFLMGNETQKAGQRGQREQSIADFVNQGETTNLARLTAGLGLGQALLGAETSRYATDVGSATDFGTYTPPDGTDDDTKLAPAPNIFAAQSEQIDDWFRNRFMKTDLATGNIVWKKGGGNKPDYAIAAKAVKNKLRQLIPNANKQQLRNFTNQILHAYGIRQRGKGAPRVDLAGLVGGFQPQIPTGLSGAGTTSGLGGLPGFAGNIPSPINLSQYPMVGAWPIIAGLTAAGVNVPQVPYVGTAADWLEGLFGGGG